MIEAQDYQCVMEPSPETTLTSYMWTLAYREFYIQNFSLPRSWNTMSKKRQRKWLRHLDRRPDQRARIEF